jgi:uncharacterized protein YodC (DUF2158 family)
MSNPIFKVGDIVNIKSDKNVKLTINELRTDTIVGNTIEETFNGFYECLWFDVTLDLRTHDFKEQILESSSETLIVDTNFYERKTADFNTPLKELLTPKN